jgi:protein-disulfide isomerase
VRLAGNPMLGTPDAPLTLIEFSDYQCPHCRRFVETPLPALRHDYIDIGKLRYVFRDFPLDRLHPQARKAAEAAHCAGEQGKYWEMHDLLFHNRQALQVESLPGYARQLGLHAAAFTTCLTQGKYAAEVQQDLADGTTAGVQGTPGFFLGKTQADGTIQGTFIRGAQPLAVFRQTIERLLGERSEPGFLTRGLGKGTLLWQNGFDKNTLFPSRRVPFLCQSVGNEAKTGTPCHTRLAGLCGTSTDSGTPPGGGDVSANRRGDTRASSAHRDP